MKKYILLLIAGLALSSCEQGYQINEFAERLGMGDGGISFGGNEGDQSGIVNQFTVGGSIIGLPTNQSISINLNGTLDTLHIDEDGNFTFDSKVNDGEIYSVEVAAETAMLGNTCVVDYGTGTVEGSNITDVDIRCSCDYISDDKNRVRADQIRAELHNDIVAQSDSNYDYYIATAEQLENYAYALENDSVANNIKFKQICDLDFSAIANHYRIGQSEDTDKEFKGHYNGSNLSISNMTMNVRKGSGQGLFGAIGQSARLENIVMKSSSIDSENCDVGTLVGRCNLATIENISIEDSSIASGENEFVASYGGIVGTADSCNVKNVSVFEVNIQNSGRASGFVVGYMKATEVEQAYANYSSISSTESDNAKLARCLRMDANRPLGYGGLVGDMIDQSYVSDAGVENSMVETINRAAGIAGNVNNSKINNVYVNATNVVSCYAAGLAASVNSENTDDIGSDINNAFVSASVQNRVDRDDLNDGTYVFSDRGSVSSRYNNIHYDEAQLCANCNGDDTNNINAQRDARLWPEQFIDHANNQKLYTSTDAELAGLLNFDTNTIWCAMDEKQTPKLRNLMNSECK